MVNYKQGKIYKIECNVTGLIYIGSTCKKKLSGRMTNHRYDYKKYLKGKKKYLSSFKVMENKDYDIILIEDYPCNSKDQLFARERYYTNTIECVNIRKNQGRLLELGIKEYNKEYRNENAETIKIKNKQYYKENSDKINEYQKEYNKENALKIKDYFKEYTKENALKIKDYHKEYYDQNIETMKIKNKEYREKNADTIKTKKNEKHTCLCGGKYTCSNKSIHIKTKKHLKYIEEQAEE